MDALHQRVHALEIIVFRNEQVGLHGHEKMADILRRVVIKKLVATVAGVPRPLI